MGGFDRLAVPFSVPPLGLFALLLLGACKTAPKMDLAENETLYVPTGYRCSIAVDREAFLTPFTDERSALEEASSSPVVYVDDGRWHRLPARMLDDVLARELSEAKLFTAVVGQPKPETLIIKPSIASWRGGITEEVTGRASFAQVGLRLVVLGPAAADGHRRTLFDEKFMHIQASEIAMIPRSPMQLFGMATRNAMVKALAAIDQSNVARSMVPLDR